jgi:hypothetical protein
MLPSEKINERVVDQLSQSITGKTWIVVDEIDQKGGKGGWWPREAQARCAAAPSQKQSWN